MSTDIIIYRAYQRFLKMNAKLICINHERYATYGDIHWRLSSTWVCDENIKFNDFLIKYGIFE